MPEINFANPINKEICCALGCNQNAETSLIIPLESKEILLHFCNLCLVRFKKFNRSTDTDLINQY